MQSLRSTQRVLHSGRSLTVVGSAVEACMAANHAQRLGDSYKRYYFIHNAYRM